jgi:chaperonin cofactor prefoldin
LPGVRQHSTRHRPRASAHEIHVPKTVELEQRIARLELKLQRTCDELEQTRQRMTALQARLDHYFARFGQI